MIRALAIVVAFAGVVHAQPKQAVTPPAGWRSDAAQASSLATKMSAVSHFGGARSLATADVFVAPDAPATLYVVSVAGKVSDNREGAARVAVDSFHESPKRAQMVSPEVVVEQWEEKLDAANNQIAAHLRWRDDEAKSTTDAVLVIAADAENMIAVTGECVAGLDSPAQVRAACSTALATIDAGIALAQRVPLALAPVGTEPPPPTGPAPTTRPPATMDDGSRAPLPPISVPAQPQRTTDRRPMYVGLGIVVLAALFWWNRRRRERFEKEHDE